MTDSPILTPEQMYEWLQEGMELTLEADDMVYRSHEALRETLALIRDGVPANPERGHAAWAREVARAALGEKNDGT